MKKHMYTLFALLLTVGVYAQSVIPQVLQYPATGFDELRNQYPYIVEQQKDTITGEWENYRKYSWASAPVNGFRAYNGTQLWDNNDWLSLNLTTDSFIMNGDGTISKVFEVVEYNYPGYTSKEKYKYTFAYDNNKHVASVKTDRTPNAGSNTYQAYNTTQMFYDNTGKRILDSNIFYGQNFKYLTRYVYDNNNMTAMYNVQLPAGDTVYRIFCAYHNNKVKSMYGESLNQTTKAWEPQTIDSITFANDKPVRRLRYGLIIFNGSDPVFQPTGDDYYTYNTDGTLSKIDEKFYMNGDWRVSGKVEFLYGNGKPTLGYHFAADESGVYETTPSGRFLFNPASGIRQEQANNLIGNLYPNPASTSLQFTVSDQTGKDARYAIYDCAGKLVLTDAATRGTMEINTSGLANGMYFLHLVSGNTSSVKKFSIIH